MAKVVVVDPVLVHGYGELLRSSVGSPLELVIPDGWELDDLRAPLAEADAVLTALRPVTADLLSLAPNLRVVGKPGAGYDNIDVAEATRRGVAVTNVSSVRGRAVAEHVFFLLLYLAKRAWLQGDPAWEFPDAVELGDQTIAVVGFGDIGKQVARIAHGFQMRVLVSTRTPAAVGAAEVPVALAELDDCLPVSDVVVLSVPLTPATRGMVDRAFLAKMRPSALLINVSRGGVVVTDDLVDSLMGGEIAGAGLDVTDPEPLPADHPLRQLPNVVVTPHNGGRTRAANTRAMAQMADNVRALLEGRGCPHLINPEARSR